MLNSEKIQKLKNEISKLIVNLEIYNEDYLFKFATQQTKEMQIEITMGELKSIIASLLILSKENIKQENDDLNKSTYFNPTEKLIDEIENPNKFTLF